MYNQTIEYSFSLVTLDDCGKFNDHNRAAYEALLKSKGLEGWQICTSHLVPVTPTESNENATMAFYVVFSRPDPPCQGAGPVRNEADVKGLAESWAKTMMPEFINDDPDLFPERPRRPGPEDDSVKWNPYNKVVQSHRTGEIDHCETNVQRSLRGLPVPWAPEMADREVREKPID